MNVPYTEFELATGRITRRGRCEPRLLPPARPGCAIVPITSDAHTQHIVYDSINAQGQPVNARAVPGRIKPHQPPVPPVEPAIGITQAQWDHLVARVDALEKRGPAQP